MAVGEGSESSARLAFIVGCGRSGTNWLGRIIDTHPNATVEFEPQSTFAAITALALNPTRSSELLEPLFREISARVRTCSTPVLVEKSHPAMWLADPILEEFPNARFVAIQRHPYQTVASMIKHQGVTAWTREWRQHPVPNAFLGIDQSNREAYDQYSLARKHAMRWASHEQRLKQLIRDRSGEVMAVNFDELVKSPASALLPVWDFLQVCPFRVELKADPATLTKWKQVLSTRDIQDIDAECARHQP